MRKYNWITLLTVLFMAGIVIGTVYYICFRQEVVISAGGDPPIGQIWKDEFDIMESTNFLSVKNRTGKEKTVGFNILGGEYYSRGDLKNENYRIVEMQITEGSGMVDNEQYVVMIPAYQDISLMIISENIYIGEKLKGQNTGIRREGAEVEVFVIKQKPEKSEQIKQTILMATLLIVLMVITCISQKKKRKWFVYPKRSYEVTMALLTGCLTGAIILCFATGEAVIKGSICLTALAVLFFTIGMLLQHKGIIKKEDILLIIPIIGKKKKIPISEINQIAFERKGYIEIAENGKEMMRITKQFHGYQEFKDILSKNVK